MTKLDFLLSLHKQLSHLPQDEVKERLGFYCEMIEDRMEEGLSEEDAVTAVGSVEEIAKQILNDISNTHIPKKTAKSKRNLKVWEIILLALGSPIWLSLLIAAFAVVLSLYICVWSVVISLWAVFVSVAVCTLGGIALGVGFMVTGNSLPGAGLIAAGIICAGLTILLFYGCKATTKASVLLAKNIVTVIKNCFIRKENA